MKKVFSLLLSVCILSVMFTSATVSADEYVRYGAVDKVVIDHVVYAKVELAEGKVSDYYMVDRFFDSSEYAKTADEVKVVDKINGLPVTVINMGASYVDGVTDGLNITKVTLPDTITYIGEYSFTNFNKVKTLDLPDNLETIRPRAFNYMTSLESITIPKNVTLIDEGVFAYCKNLKKVKFDGKVTEISDNAFINCKSLKKITLQKTIEKIGESAFAGSGLESIKIPADIYPGEYAFGDCLSLKKVVYKGSVGRNSVFGIYDGCFFGCTKLEKVYLPKSAKKIYIGDYAFYSCKSLKKIYNASEIVSIGKNAFENCKALVSFKISSKIKKIEAESFKGCKSLKDIKILTKNTKVFNNKNIFNGISKTCKMYIKTKAVKKAVINCGFKGKVIINRNLKQ